MTDVVVRRFIPVPRERAFAAWLDPASMVQWMLPGDTRHASVEADARVGGQFRIVMDHGRGGADHWGEYLVVDPPSRLSFTWISEHTDRLPTVVTIDFHEREGGTEIVLTHRGLPASQAQSHQNGWGDIVRKMGEALG
jgi:uncharacterized protein YndB with AHSA1/START domain